MSTFQGDTERCRVTSVSMTFICEYKCMACKTHEREHAGEKPLCTGEKTNAVLGELVLGEQELTLLGERELALGAGGAVAVKSTYPMIRVNVTSIPFVLISE